MEIREKKNIITLKEHEEYGIILRKLYDQLLEMTCVRKKDENKNVTNAYKSIIKLRSDMEEIMFVSHPKEANVYTYYGRINIWKNK